MVWEQLSINKPHLVYIILGGFTSIFMLCSLFIKEKLYIGEATIATIAGVIFGPFGANLIDPGTWGNTDQITLEFSRIVLVVQCFAVGVELPKAYMERHWKSVVLLLLPVMTFGWLITSLFIWWLIGPLNWLQSLACAACVTATDPVLASSVVGKGKFAKRVPKHIRDLLSAESGCNDGMAFPFVYLALNLIHYHLGAKEVTKHWILNTILYEVVWGAVFGYLVGYIARHAIKQAEARGIIDRESFLVFYFVLALFCAGSGSLLGMDDLLIGFAAGVGFSNDGWFTEKTEESHVSNVIDLLINLTYFVYLGTILPWDQYNSHLHGLDVWRLVVIAILVLLLRRIPIMMALKPIIPDIKTWREALFCGHFGPIGVGAIFVAILARAELETDTTTPLAQLPDPSAVEYDLIYLIWPITTFLVVTSIVVHGSSIAVFTLGRRINTLTMTLSFTKGNENSHKWMDRLPRIASRSKSEGASYDTDDYDEKPGDLEDGIPKLELRRQKEADNGKTYKPRSRSRSKGGRKRKSYDAGMGPGGVIEESAICPAPRQRANSEPELAQQESGSDTLNERSERPSPERLTSEQLERLKSHDSDLEQNVRDRYAEKDEQRGRSKSKRSDSDVDIDAYQDGHTLTVEDAEGNVVSSVNTNDKSPEEKARIIEKAREKVRDDDEGYFTKHNHEAHTEQGTGSNFEAAAEDEFEHPGEGRFMSHFRNWKGFGKGLGDSDKKKERKRENKKEPERKSGPAHAYQIGNTIIVEDEDGEVIKKYDIPREEGEGPSYNDRMREGLQRMGTFVGLDRKKSNAPASAVPNLDASEKDHASKEGSPNRDSEEEAKTPGLRQKKTRPDAKRERQKSEDDGLRMVISKSEQYGMTGLRKPKPGDRPGMLDIGGGRRLSTKDFIRQMQDLDRESRQSIMNKHDISGDVQHEVHKGAAKKQMDEGTIKEEDENESQDYFSKNPSHSRDEATRLGGPSKNVRPQATRSQTDASLNEQDVPSHDVRQSINQHAQAGTSANARRARFNKKGGSEDDAGDKHNVSGTARHRRHEKEHQQYQTSSAMAEKDDRYPDETAVEKKRRLAAQGLIKDDGESSSDEDQPRNVAKAVHEPDSDSLGRVTSRRSHNEPPTQQSAETSQATRGIQWGGVTRGAVFDNDGDEGGNSGGGVKGRLKGLFK